MASSNGHFVAMGTKARTRTIIRAETEQDWAYNYERSSAANVSLFNLQTVVRMRETVFIEKHADTMESHAYDSRKMYLI